MNDRTNPTPIDPTLLVKQKTHRSEHIWNHGGKHKLSAQRAECKTWKLLNEQVLDRRIIEYFIEAGLYGLYRVGMILLDWDLITALVERWREETHTFHLPIGEVTITLQDCGYLLGLPVDGAPVTSMDAGRTTSEWCDLVEMYLGHRPPAGTVGASAISGKWLRQTFAKLPDDANDEVVRQYTRAYLLLLVGGCLFPDKSKNKIELHYLPLLSNLEKVKDYSWGSAALAYLYRELCNASGDSTRKGISGPLVLLQIWAWERITVVRPKRLSRTNWPQSEPIDEVYAQDAALPLRPWGSRWRVAKDLGDTPTHVLEVYRYQLDTLREGDFVWLPYLMILPQYVPDYCVSGKEIWMAKVPLICFHIVELYFPDRVMRQFGIPQHIPDHPNTYPELHVIQRSGRFKYSWASYHDKWIQLWNARLEMVVHPRPPQGNYMAWYKSVTRRFIRNPTIRPTEGFVARNGEDNYMVEQMTQVYLHLHSGYNNLSQMSSEEISSFLRRGMDMCCEALRNIHLQPPPPPPPPPPGNSSAQFSPPQRRRRHKVPKGPPQSHIVQDLTLGSMYNNSK